MIDLDVVKKNSSSSPNDDIPMGKRALSNNGSRPRSITLSFIISCCFVWRRLIAAGYGEGGEGFGGGGGSGGGFGGGGRSVQ